MRETRNERNELIDMLIEALINENESHCESFDSSCDFLRVKRKAADAGLVVTLRGVRFEIAITEGK